MDPGRPARPADHTLVTPQPLLALNDQPAAGPADLSDLAVHAPPPRHDRGTVTRAVRRVRGSAQSVVQTKSSPSCPPCSFLEFHSRPSPRISLPNLTAPPNLPRRRAAQRRLCVGVHIRAQPVTCRGTSRCAHVPCASSRLCHLACQPAPRSICTWLDAAPNALPNACHASPVLSPRLPFRREPPAADESAALPKGVAAADPAAATNL